MEQNRGGFERERIQPERIPPEPVRSEVRRDVVERVPAPGPGIAWRPDLTHWSSVWSGFFVSLAVMVLMAAIGVGIGFTDSTAIGIWAAVTLIVGFFCGGWFAARTASEASSDAGLIQGAAVWAVTTAGLLVLGSLGLAGALGLGGVVPGITMPAPPTAPGIPEGAAQLAGWASFVALILGLIASLIGGYVGSIASRYPSRPAR